MCIFFYFLNLLSLVLLIWNCLQERAKIQGKRKPPSRQARQEAIKAVSTEENYENSSLPQPPSSNLMSPSTDEEDLFSVPPLDVITDGVKTASPKDDIFGTPTVLSPITKPDPPSSFVSAPFFQSQPPPLDNYEEEEVVSNYGDDIFEHQDHLKYDIKHIQSKEVKTQTKKKSKTGDSFHNLQDDYLFSNLRDGPPPLTNDDDDDDEQDYDDLFSSNKQTTNNLPPDLSRNSLFSSQNMFVDKSVENIFAKTLCTSSENAIEVVTDDSLFASDIANDTVIEDVLFSSNVKHSLNETEKTLLNPSSTLSKASSPGDSLFSEPIKSQDLEHDDLLYSKDHPSILSVKSQSLAKDDVLNSTLSGQKIIDDPSKNVSKNPVSVVAEPLGQSFSDTHNNTAKHTSLLSSNSSIKYMESNDCSSMPFGTSIKFEDDDDDDLFTQSTSSVKVKDEKHQPAILAPGKLSHPVSKVLKDNVNSLFNDDVSLFSQTTVNVKKTEKDAALFNSDKLSQSSGEKTTIFAPPTSSSIVNSVTGVSKVLASSDVKSSESLPRNTQSRSSNALGSILSDGNEEDDDSLFTSSTTGKQTTKTIPSFIKETSQPSRKGVFFDDEENETTDLFANKVIQNSEKQKTKAPVSENQSLSKKSLLFEDKEESSDLFSAENKIKTLAPLKTSLFGDDGDEDDIFGSSTFNNPLKKTLTKAAATKTSQTVAGNNFVYKHVGLYCFLIFLIPVFFLNPHFADEF